MQEETDVLVWKIQALPRRIYGATSKPPRADEDKLVWKEVANISSVMKTAAQYVMTCINLIHIQFNI